jgi:hypothetical protein
MFTKQSQPPPLSSFGTGYAELVFLSNNWKNLEHTWSEKPEFLDMTTPQRLPAVVIEVT